MPDILDTMTTAEAAAALGISTRQFHRDRVQFGIVPLVRGHAPGEQARYARHDIERLQHARRQRSAGAAGDAMAAMTVLPVTDAELVARIAEQVAARLADRTDMQDTAMADTLSTIQQQMAAMAGMAQERLTAQAEAIARLTAVIEAQQAQLAALQETLRPPAPRRPWWRRGRD